MSLIDSLNAYTPADKKEETDHRFILTFIRTRARPFDRGNFDAHLTGSAIVVDGTRRHVLLGYHRKLNRWLQLGGHGEPGDTDGLQVALREACEESGLAGLHPFPSAPQPFDVDVHEIPQHADVPPHLHLDLRYVLSTRTPGDPVYDPNEHDDVRWFTWADALAMDVDASLARCLRKAQRLVNNAPE
jgi:8-oxo-dGTP pyrophosphatase MutT (NUDIX family)